MKLIGFILSIFILSCSTHQTIDDAEIKNMDSASVLESTDYMRVTNPDGGYIVIDLTQSDLNEDGIVDYEEKVRILEAFKMFEGYDIEFIKKDELSSSSELVENLSKMPGITIEVIEQGSENK